MTLQKGIIALFKEMELIERPEILFCMRPAYESQVPQVPLLLQIYSVLKRGKMFWTPQKGPEKLASWRIWALIETQESDLSSENYSENLKKDKSTYILTAPKITTSNEMIHAIKVPQMFCTFRKPILGVQGLTLTAS